MPEIAGIPQWAVITTAVAVVVIVLGLAAWFLLGRASLMRRYLVVLIGTRESIRAARRTLEAVMRHLADEPDEPLEAFAADPASPDRRALAETAARMRLLSEDLDTRPLPARLVALAEELADAAYVIAEETERVQDGMCAEEVLGALATIDLRRVAVQMDEADRYLDEACALFGVEDTAVYGGGLYI